MAKTISFRDVSVEDFCPNMPSIEKNMSIDWDGFEDFLEQIERNTENITLESFTNKKPLEFIVMTYILHANYRICRNKLRHERLTERTTERKRKANTSIGRYASKRSSSRMSHAEPTEAVDMEKEDVSEKVDKYECIPDVIRKSKSSFVQSMIIMYMLHHIRPEYQNILLLHMLENNKDLDIVNLRKLTARTTLTNADLVPYQYPNIRTVDKKVIKSLVHSMFVLSALINDRVFSYRAGLMNLPLYLEICLEFSTRDVMTKITPFEYLIHVFLNECVPRKDKDIEKSRIHNQFKGSKKLLLATLVEHVRKAVRPEKTAKRIPNVNVEPDQEYEVYIGPLNYLNNLKVGYLEHGNRTYTVVFYNDCLYDVTNSFITPKYNDGEIGDKQLYLDLPWSHRLNLVDYRSKIELEPIRGDEISRMVINATLTLSWQGDDSYMRMRSINLRTDKSTNHMNGNANVNR